MVIIEFSCFVWAMVVWDNIEIDIKTTMSSYFAVSTGAAMEPNSVDAIRWDRLHVKVNIPTRVSLIICSMNSEFLTEIQRRTKVQDIGKRVMKLKWSWAGRGDRWCKVLSDWWLRKLSAWVHLDEVRPKPW